MAKETTAKAGKEAKKPAAKPAKKATKTLVPFPEPQNVVIENVSPAVDDGRFSIRREPGDVVEVRADIFRHSHEKIAADVLYRKLGEKEWRRAPMSFVDNDLWGGSFSVDSIGYWEYTVEARTVEPADAPSRADRIYELRVDPVYARCCAWYEMFPRSQGKVPGKSGTWDDCRARLDDVCAMGFDTVYLTPIHPVGQTNKKGPNNSLHARPENPGCPYAVGNTKGGWGDGGSMDIERSLGTWEQFHDFVAEAKGRGLKLALDIALNCSPDHPHVQSHPEWYCHEADGTIKFAENPPKKYEDIYPYDYFNENWKALWTELRDMILFWAGEGFTFFRIDNPHTKPFQFWEWLIREVKLVRPDVVFLAEAFTRPKIMKRLAKVGFDMSYTYFTWRNEKWELEEYLKELTTRPLSETMRGIFFPTTPDIHPKILWNAPREAFMVRLMLAATLDSAYGMYNGFELCENEPFPGGIKDELANSEKYDFKVRDWNRPGNIKAFVARLNAIRRENPAMAEYTNLRFHYADNPQIMCYSKRDEKTGNTMLFVVNLDPYPIQSAWCSFDMEALGLPSWGAWQVEDQLTGERYTWEGNRAFVKLDPKKSVGHALKVL